MKAPPCFEDSESKRIIRKICEEHRVNIDLLTDLCDIVNEYAGSGRRFGLIEEIEAAIDRFSKTTKES
jgi:hypothetical protein